MRLEIIFKAIDDSGDGIITEARMNEILSNQKMLRDNLEGLTCLENCGTVVSEGLWTCCYGGAGLQDP